MPCHVGDAVPSLQMRKLRLQKSVPLARVVESRPGTLTPIHEIFPSWISRSGPGKGQEPVGLGERYRPGKPRTGFRLDSCISAGSLGMLSSQGQSPGKLAELPHRSLKGAGFFPCPFNRHRPLHPPCTPTAGRQTQSTPHILGLSVHPCCAVCHCETWKAASCPVVGSG